MITTQQLLDQLGKPLTEWASLNYEIVLRDEDGNWYGDLEILSVDEQPKEKKIFINFSGSKVINAEEETLL